MSIRRALPALAFAALTCSVLACGPSGGTAARSGGTVADPETIPVEASEFAFAPASLTVPAGALTFAVRNVGTVEHEFEVFKGEQVVDEVEGLVPGLTRELRVTLDAGEYTYVCKLAGHEEAGMKGTLTVTD